MLFRLFLLITIPSLFLLACGGQPVPTLAAAGQPTLVYLYTDPWAPWAQTTPIVDGLEAAYSGQLVIKRFNANEGDGPAIMRAYDIPGHPAILIFDRQGQEIERFIGPQSETAIETILQQNLDLRR